MCHQSVMIKRRLNEKNHVIEFQKVVLFLRDKKSSENHHWYCYVTVCHQSQYTRAAVRCQLYLIAFEQAGLVGFWLC
jgi:hypothetical protein